MMGELKIFRSGIGLIFSVNRYKYRLEASELQESRWNLTYLLIQVVIKRFFFFLEVIKIFVCFVFVEVNNVII